MNIFTLLIPGIVTSLIAAFIIWIFKNIFTSIQERSDFSGKWLNCMYDEKNQIIKKDIIQIKHNKKTNWIHGKSKRIYPQKDDYKNWKVIGLLMGKDIICLIWSTRSFVSLNCSYLTQTKNEGYEYEGFCLKNIDGIKKYRITLSKKT